MSGVRFPPQPPPSHAIIPTRPAAERHRFSRHPLPAASIPPFPLAQNPVTQATQLHRHSLHFPNVAPSRGSAESEFISVRLTLLLLFSLSCTSCVSTTADGPDPLRQPWRDSWSAKPEAKAGLPNGLHRSFQAARNQVEMPFANGGEDAEAISDNLRDTLDAVGDEKILSRPASRASRDQNRC